MQQYTPLLPVALSMQHVLLGLISLIVVFVSSWARHWILQKPPCATTPFSWFLIRAQIPPSILRGIFWWILLSKRNEEKSTANFTANWGVSQPKSTPQGSGLEVLGIFSHTLLSHWKDKDIPPDFLSHLLS